MYKKMNELITMLEDSGKCEVKLINREKHTYSIEQFTKLNWRRRSKRFGRIHAGEKRLRIDLDFPRELFSTEDLQKYIKLPLKSEAAHQRTSHLDLLKNEKGYDTAAIHIYRSQLDDYAFDDLFAIFISKVIDANTRE
ncbi:hypothetical protein [Sediminibacillus albus]|uniref:Uncharacterized protein n=1 Tax=Sediminibacillus albus TaxID=407036 RepID=A0A1G8YI88_9BACI|nr:hypothetical protein [Sediminibacillus albus]SDK01810.1 hypothetical protein SAMN05216243_1600 [Sediminibacillus albus]